MLNVLFLHDTPRNGGPAGVLYNLLANLDPAVIRRVVMVPREGEVTEMFRAGGVADELFVEPRFIENPVEPWSRAIVRADFDAPPAVRAVRAAGNVARAATAMGALVRRVRRERFDVIVCNGTSACFAGAAIAALTGVPAVWYVFYSSVGAPIRALHARLAASRAVRRILCVSRPTTVQFAHCMGKVRLVGDAIDTRAFDPARVTPALRAELGVGGDEVVVGSHGRVIRRKGYVEMVRAARLACDLMSERERAACRFVVVGDTPQDFHPDHRDECLGLVRELGLEGRFLFPGYRRDPMPYVADFDVAVVPSVYEDPLPRAVMESMSLAKPVVAFARGGIPELVEDGVTGALVAGSPPDVDGLARAILRYVRDPELRRRHGAAGRARACEKLDARAHGRAMQREILAAAAGA